METEQVSDGNAEKPLGVERTPLAACHASTFGKGMIKKMRYKWWAWRFVRRTLLVCAGSHTGRVPYAMIERKSARSPRVQGCRLWIDEIGKGPSWHFEIISPTEQDAQKLAEDLRRRGLYEIHPDGERIRTILFRRDDWGEGIGWIGGDITLEPVDEADYVLSGNHAYIHKDVVGALRAGQMGPNKSRHGTA